MGKKKTQVKVIQDEEEVPVEILAKSIRDISRGYERMKKAGLTERAIIVLLHDVSRVNRLAIKDVLWGMGQLKKIYLTD